MGEDRQQILILYSGNSALDSGIVGWSVYDGTGSKKFEAFGPEEKPPYASVLDAMKDGWRVIQVPPISLRASGEEFRLGPLKFEFVLEKIVSKGEGE